MSGPVAPHLIVLAALNCWAGRVNPASPDGPAILERTPSILRRSLSAWGVLDGRLIGARSGLEAARPTFDHGRGRNRGNPSRRQSL